MKLRNKAIKYSAVVTAVAASSSAFATESNAITAAINGAISAGQANYSLVVVGIIGLAAIGFGLTMIVSSMRK